MIDMIAFGEKLRNHRKKMNMTQEDVAAAVGVSPQAVSKWENGECLPDCWNLKLLGETYGVSLDILMDSASGDIGEAAAKIMQIGDEFIWSKADRDAAQAHRDLGEDLWQMWKGLYFIEVGSREHQQKDMEEGNLRISGDYGLKIWDDDGVACIVRNSLKQRVKETSPETEALLRELVSPDGMAVIKALDSLYTISKADLESRLGIDPSRLNELLLLFTENRIIEFGLVSGVLGYKIHAANGIAAYMIMAAAYILGKTKYTTSEYIPN